MVHLVDRAAGVTVSVAPTLGNRAYEMLVHGQNILYFPGLASPQAAGLNAVPFLAPWANRLDEQGFWANGKHYAFDMALGNVRGATPLHGLLTAAKGWRVTDASADAQSAHVTSRFEFWRYPDLMAQWPFAHEYEMTYRLSGGTLEVAISVTNLSTESMPVVLGFHPYFRIPDVPRDEWKGRVPARQHVVADQRLIPTGEMQPTNLADPFDLKGLTLDDGYTDLIRDAQGLAHFSIEARGKKVEVLFGKEYKVGLVWEPNGQPAEFICFEPMTAITNAVNLEHAGKYSGVPKVAPGAKWSESFWIRSTGF